MAPRTPSLATARPRRPGVLIARHALVACGPFGATAATKVAAALARGMLAAGAPEPDVVELPADGAAPAALAALLAEVDFDARMRAARALVVASARLDEATLAPSPAFEVATRARQSGVPAYAVTASDGLDSFDARILDLQMVIEADGALALAAAGRRLAALV